MKRLSIIIILFVTLGIAIYFYRLSFQKKGGEGENISVTESVIQPKGILSMDISSSAFQNNETIAQKYTCDGENVNPSLAFSNIPEEAKSLVLILDDPDAPAGVWNHWIVWNISPTVGKIEENSAPEGAIQGKNDFDKNEYGGPCPPPGKPHRYRFKVFALDRELSLSENSSQKDVEEAIKDHILAQAELVGIYGR